MDRPQPEKKMPRTTKSTRSKKIAPEEYVDDEDGFQKIKVWKDRFDLSNFHLPTITIVSIILFCIWVTWSASQERANIQSQLLDVATKIHELGERDSKLNDNVFINSKRLDAIENKNNEEDKAILDTQKNVQNGQLWSLRDHLVWCLETQIANPGWKCIKEIELQPIVQAPELPK